MESIEKKRCMVCGKLVVMIKGGICDPCQQQIRGEALGKNAGLRSEAEKELKKHGVQTDPGSSETKK
jgi:hypothetical protein